MVAALLPALYWLHRRWPIAGSLRNLAIHVAGVVPFSIAHTLGKPTILLARTAKDVPFDIAGLRAIIYDVDNLAQFRAELSRTIDATFGQDRLDEARCLIESGMYRAAVALLGIVLEHDLRFVIERNNIGLTGRIGPRPLTIAQSLRLGCCGAVRNG